jgi:hypothetical protein
MVRRARGRSPGPEVSVRQRTGREFPGPGTVTGLRDRLSAFGSTSEEGSRRDGQTRSDFFHRHRVGS